MAISISTFQSTDRAIVNSLMVCDTEAEKPTGPFKLGDVVIVRESNKVYIANRTDSLTEIIGALAVNNARAIELGDQLSGNRDVFIDFHGDDTYTDYGLRVWRTGGGPNSASVIDHRGTGPLKFQAADAGTIDFYTNSAQRAYFDSNGILQFTAAVQDKIVFYPTVYKMGIENFGLYFEINNNVNDHFAFKSAGTEVFRIQSQGNVGINTGTFGTNAVAVLAIKSSTAPTSSPTDTIQIWAEDVAGSHEARVRDEGGTVTTFSPHNFTLFEPDPQYEFPWSYYSRNDYLGKEINVDMFGLAREVEKLSGKKLIYLKDTATKAWESDKNPPKWIQDRLNGPRNSR